jgi:hypothetical protein
MNTKIRTAIITLIAVGSFGSTALVPGAAQATTKEKDLTGKSYTCEHTSDNLTVCTDKEGHEWYCEESTDECGQVKVTLLNTTKLRVPVTSLYAAPSTTTPPVLVKVARAVTSARYLRASAWAGALGVLPTDLVNI